MLTADAFVELVCTAEPSTVGMISEPAGERDAVLDYGQVPAGLVGLLEAGNAGRTRIWLDVSSDTIRRVDVSIAIGSGADSREISMSQAYVDHDIRSTSSLPGDIARPD